MRRLLTVSLVAAALALPASAAASVKVITLTPSVHPGGSMAVAVLVIPGSPCSIRVHYGSRPPIVASGLYTKGPLFQTIHWNWKMPARALRGRWAIDLACGGAGTLHATFLVR
jgi:hypothetical protein